MAKTSGKIRKLHNIIGLVFGAQLLFWMVSGLFFTLFPIEQIHGTTLRAPINHGALALGQVQISANEAAQTLASKEAVTSVALDMFLGEPVWKLKTGSQIHMISARTGEARSPITPLQAAQIAREGLISKAGLPGEPRLLRDHPPREYGGALPAYIVDYKPGSVRVYIDANTGQLVTVRSNLWRTFDVMWRFHIMDITGADEFDTWWMKLFAFFGLTLVLSGGVLVVRRVRRGTIFR